MSAPVFSPASSAVLVAPTAEALFGLWSATRSRPDAPGAGLRFASFAEVEAASAHGVVAMSTPIEVRLPGERARVATTVGRILLIQALPVPVGFESVNRAINASAAAQIIEVAHALAGLDGAESVARALWSFGARAAESGVSLSLDDLRSPAAREAILAEAREACDRTEQRWDDGQITLGERFNTLTDAWIAAEARLREALSGELAARPPLGDLAASGALPGIEGLSRCAGMVGVTRNPGGDLAEIPVIHGFAAGLSSHETFRIAVEARADAVRLLEREVEARELGERLAAALGSVRITTLDCGTRDGITVGCLLDSHRVLASLGTRLLGRVLAEEVRSMDGRTLLAEAGSIVDEAAAARIDRELVPAARIRSPLTCAAATGVCARCHGWEVQSRRPSPLRARVGLTAARAIASLAPRLVERPIYLGGDGYESARDADSTTAPGGLPRLLEILMAREPERTAILAEADGVVQVTESGEKGIRMRLDPDDGGPPFHYWIPEPRREALPCEGQVVRGEKIARRDSPRSPRTLLRIFGLEWMINAMKSELCDIFGYSRQPIADVHLEIVIHEMLRHTRVEAGVRRPVLRGLQELARAAHTASDR